MKRILGVCLLVVGSITALIGTLELIIDKLNVASNISIIGGADGPTTIFLAGRLGKPVYVNIIGGIISFIIGLMLILIYGESQNEKK